MFADSSLYKLSIFTRSLRLHTLPFSILPFVVGATHAKVDFQSSAIYLIFFSIICIHISANLINDYIDAIYHIDSRDMQYYQYFGGSKLIQENKLSKNQVLTYALLFAIGGLILTAIPIIFLTGNPWSMLYISLLLILSWSYSIPPFKFSYRYLSLPILILCCGPISFLLPTSINNGIAIKISDIYLSLPCGLLVAAFYVCSETAHWNTHRRRNKKTIIKIITPDYAYILFFILICSAATIIFASYQQHFLGKFSLLIIIAMLPLLKACWDLKNFWSDKTCLREILIINISTYTISMLVLAINLGISK